MSQVLEQLRERAEETPRLVLEVSGKFVANSKGKRWLESGHPWLYRDDVERVEGAPAENLPALCAIEDVHGQWLGWALSGGSQSRIAARRISRVRDVPDRAFWRERVAACVRRRERFDLLGAEDACRLIGGDSEGVPGWVCDRYADVLVTQSGTGVADALTSLLSYELCAALPFEVRAVFNRSDATVRRHEGLESRVEVIAGELPNSDLLVAEADGFCYEVDVAKGHKTGHYLDMSANRRHAATFASGQRVLDIFSYDGLFGVRAARAGASEVLCLDQSQEAGERALRNAARNGIAEGIVRFEKVDALRELKGRSDTEPGSYGLVICDPPLFARSRKEIAGAERGYVEVNRRSIALCAPGGVVVTATCSHNVRPGDFRTYLARAAVRARREVYLEEMRGAGPDHPIRVELPESSYLQCAFLRVE
ncbi:MAG: class I SAM-dependent rRNA methyltransferase [Planctomycetota bacterium]